MTNQPRIVQALLITDPGFSREFGAHLWAALHEVETLFRDLGIRHEMRRLYLSHELPDVLRDARNESAEFARRAERILRQPPTSPHGQIAQELIGPELRKILDLPPDDVLVVIVDREITPPQGWNYILWSSTATSAPAEGWTVASTAPMDPIYWNERRPDRAHILRRRARAACAAVTARWLGFRGCHNPACFLFQPVDSVMQLDDMEVIGSEHRDDRPLREAANNEAGRRPPPKEDGRLGRAPPRKSEDHKSSKARPK